MGGVHGDAIRNIEGTSDYVNSGNVVYDKAFFISTKAGVTVAAQSGGNSSSTVSRFNASRVVPTANKVQPRAWGALACVYLGAPR